MAVPSSFWGVAAALVVAVLGIGSFAVVQQQRVDELVDEMDSMAAEYAETESRLQEQQELTQLAIQPGVSRAAMRAVSPPTPPREPAAGMLFHKPGGGRVLWITNLEPLEDGTMYQAWLRESEQDAYSIAIFEVDDTGQALVPVRVPDDSSQWSWLTVNRAPVGGATEPMGSPLLAGRIE
jgi:hypothetical protein